jgi:leader peptidase (prepilin peptidase)/N-methyltransferase
MSTTLGAVLAALLGAIIGSFLNVVAYRLPRKESLSHPPSHCPRCGAPVKPYDNIPVLSWLLLRGRCRACKEPISIRYPLVEGGTALLCAAVVVDKGPHISAVIGIVFVLLLVPITLIDLDERIIPNKLTYPGCVIALVLVAIDDPGKLLEHVIAGVAAGGFLLAAILIRPGGMGLGDAKLSLMMGLFLGRAVGPAMFAGMIAGALVGAVIIARVGVERGRKTKIPFGPYLAFGGLVGLFVGGPIVDAYLDTFK